MQNKYFSTNASFSEEVDRLKEILNDLIENKDINVNEYSTFIASCREFFESIIELLKLMKEAVHDHTIEDSDGSFDKDGSAIALKLISAIDLYSNMIESFTNTMQNQVRETRDKINRRKSEAIADAKILRDRKSVV